MSDQPRPRQVNPLELVSIVLVGAASALLLAGIIYAFAYASVRHSGGTERFRLLAQAASPFVALLLVAGVALVVWERGRDELFTLKQVASGVVLGLGAAAALLTVLLALNGVVVDLTTANTAGLFRVSNVLGRFVTVTLAGYALALAITAPTRRSTPPVLAPRPSPPGAQDSASPT